MRSAAEIMGEFADDELTAHQWRTMHVAIKAAQAEARREALEDAAIVAQRDGLAIAAANAIRALIDKPDPGNGAG